MKVLLVVACTLGLHNCIAQEYPRTNADLSRITDELASYQDNNVNYEDLYENYVQLFANPIDLNRASPDELRMLNILSENQLNQLIKYREEKGRLLTVYELQAIPDFDTNTIQKLAPFVIVKDPKSKLDKETVRRLASGKNTYIISRVERSLQKSAGYTAHNANAFMGSPYKTYTRFRSANPGDYSFGFTAEKDPGEKATWNPSAKEYGMDYISAHLQFQNKGKIKNFIAGDFNFQFGQGLLLGNAFGLGKGGETITTARKSNIGFMPYTSVNEGGYMRGVATTIELSKHIFLSAFYSSTNRDANITDGDVPSFSTLNVSGLHRNQNELQIRKQIQEKNYGTVISYKTSNIETGIILNAIQFNIPIQKNPNAYNQFAFQGRSNTNAGAFFNYSVNNVTVFSEAGKSLGGGAGFVAGLLTSLHANLDVALVFRTYAKNFYPFYSNAFAESTTPQNENGMYWGLKYRFNKKYTLSGYTDLFQFPWLKFRMYQPSRGNEFLFRFNYQPTKKIIMFAQFRQESKARNVGDLLPTYETMMGTKRNLWLSCDYSISPSVRMKTRAQFSAYNFSGSISSGMTIMQDISAKLGKFEFTGRHALFDTDNFDNRQYVYENDVWLAFSLPAYDGKGTRDYLMIEYKLTRRFSLWAKYARISYQNITAISDGVQKISGNHRDDIKLQAMLRL
jgi:hypothetical protein